MPVNPVPEHHGQDMTLVLDNVLDQELTGIEGADVFVESFECGVCGVTYQYRL